MTGNSKLQHSQSPRVHTNPESRRPLHHSNEYIDDDDGSEDYNEYDMHGDHEGYDTHEIDGQENNYYNAEEEYNYNDADYDNEENYSNGEHGEHNVNAHPSHAYHNDNDDEYGYNNEDHSFDEQYNGIIRKYDDNDSYQEDFQNASNNQYNSDHSFKPNISPFAKQLKQEHISMRAKQVIEESNRKLQEIAKDLEKRYNHSFHPQINNSYVMKRDRTHFHDSIDERIHEKEEHYKRMEEKKLELESKTDFSYTPEISTYSKTLERQEPIYERLYKLRKVIESPDISRNDDSRESFASPPNSARRRSVDSRVNQSRVSGEDFTFHPQINEVPQHILEARKGKIEDRMYNHAIMREQKREQDLKNQQNQAKKVTFSNKTRQLAKQRVVKEIEIAFRKVSTNTDEQEPYINYVQLGHCLALLGLFKSGNSREERRDEQEVRVHEEIWNLLDPSDSGMVNLDTLLAILCPLIDRELFPLSDDVSNANKATFKQLSLRMKELSVNKLAYSKSSELIKETRQRNQPVEPSFAPKINNVSKSIDSKKLSEESGKSGPRYEILFQKENEKKMKLDSLRKSIDAKVMKECSFQPTLQTKQYKSKSANNSQNTSSGESRFEYLYNLKDKAKKVTTPEVNNEEKELEACTFKPDTSASRLYREHIPRVSSRAQIRGFEKQIERMKKGQEERNRVNNFYESLRKNRDSKWEGRMKSSDKGQEFQPTEVKPFRFNLDKRTRSKPLLFMDVNLGPGRTGRIGIHAKDDPQVLANNFAVSYRLDPVLTKRLEDLIYQNMILNNIPMGDSTPSPQNSNAEIVNISENSYRSPAATYAGSYRQNYEDQYEDSDSYIEESESIYQSPIRNSPPTGDSPKYARPAPPKPEPSPSRKLYDSLRQLKEFTEQY